MQEKTAAMVTNLYQKTEKSVYVCVFPYLVRLVHASSWISAVPHNSSDTLAVCPIRKFRNSDQLSICPSKIHIGNKPVLTVPTSTAVPQNRLTLWDITELI